MWPMFSASDITHGGFADTIFGGYYSRVAGIDSYLKNLSLGKFATSILQSSCPDEPPLLTGILKVIQVSTKKKMIGVYTRRVITVMENKKSFRDRATVNEPRYSVGFVGVPATIIETAITPSINTGFPYPAPRNWVWSPLSVKSFFDWMARVPVILSTWHNSLLESLFCFSIPQVGAYGNE